MSRQRVVVAMSGGVDSAVAALLLCEQGYDVVGVFLRTGVTETPRGDGRHRGCCSAVDARDARRVGDRLGIPCYALDFAAEFQGVMDYFADEYVHGRTPNPCVVCNSRIKFGRLWEIAKSLGAEFLATGHYARVADHAGRPTLHRAVDARKDQTYVLFGLPAALLPRLRFPIGDLSKEEVRQRARAADLPVAEKAESQDICFIPEGDAAAFVRRQRPGAEHPGAIVDTQGRNLARHAGIAHFTIGQRKGLGLDRSTLRGQRRFVLDIIPEEAKVIVGTEDQGRVHSVAAEQCNWFVEPRPAMPCHIRWSHRGGLAAGHVSVTPSGASVTFDEPQFGIAPGQAIVFYRDDLVLGGGWIAEKRTRPGDQPLGS